MELCLYNFFNIKTRASGMKKKKKLAIYILYWLLERVELRCLTAGATLN